MVQTPVRQMMEEALKEFREALVRQGVYDRDHQNLDRAYNGAKDFVDFLLDRLSSGSIDRGRAPDRHELTALWRTAARSGPWPQRPTRVTFPSLTEGGDYWRSSSTAQLSGL